MQEVKYFQASGKITTDDLQKIYDIVHTENCIAEIKWHCGRWHTITLTENSSFDSAYERILDIMEMSEC
jgi:hypothetical protein